MFQSGDTLVNWLFLGVSISGFLLIIALFMKRSNGLFLARTITQYKTDKDKAEYEKERHIGKTATDYILRYVTPIFIGFFTLLLLRTFNLI